MTTACLSHGHADHIGGLAFWASQRYLNSLGRGSLYAPAAIADDVAALLEVHARLEGGEPYAVDLSRVSDGDTVPLRPDFDLSFFATDHWVPTLGSALSWRRKRLKPEYTDADADQLRAVRRRGETITHEVLTPLVTYGADSGPGIFAQPALAAEVVLLECSFFADRDLDRARRFGHLHLADLVAAVPRLESRHLVLLHGSSRYRLREIEDMMRVELAPVFGGGLHHLMVDWD